MHFSRVFLWYRDLAIGLSEDDVEAVDDTPDPEGEEPEEQVDPEMAGDSDLERYSDWRDEDREQDHDEGVVFEIGHWLRFLFV